ncbi:MAG TPA: hypothetical protein VHP14_27235 [Anaerolineales bacterium]|nr:hypothetical protein [Anaerolineales bacterium]
MRKLSSTFLRCLKTGFLSEITQRVQCDHDLNLEIRNGYINVYYKGNSLLKLAEAGSLLCYKAEIHPKFLEGINIPLGFTEETIHQFMAAIPLIKENIVRYGDRSRELEYEQMIIRANNFEPSNNTEYFIVDRQYAEKDGRFDLNGVFWKRGNRQRNLEAQPCFMEVKFALNSDIRNIHNQLAGYYEFTRNNAAGIAKEMETVFKQKLELGLYHQDAGRLAAMKKLTFSQNIEDFQFIVILVDYNENSSLFEPGNLQKLPFASQVKVFYTGFGMWSQNVKPVR